MGPFEMVVALVAIGVGGSVIRDIIKRTQHTGKADIKEIHERLSRLEDLEERICVLEKVVTDPKEKLKEEINSL